MKTIVRGAACVAAAAALGFVAAPRLHAQQRSGADPSTADAPAADSVVVWAIAVSPEIAAARARATAARTRAAAARGLEDPMLEVFFQDVGFPDNTLGKEEMSMLGAEVRQPLPFFGKRGARHAAAEAEAVVATAEVRTLERQIGREVRLQYARLYAAQHRRATLESADALLAVLGEVASTRYAAGKSGMEAPLKAQLARSRLQDQLQDVVAERRQAEAELARLLGRPADMNWGRVSVLPAPAPPPADWSQLAAANAPAVGARRAAVTAADRRTEAEQREGRPDWFAGAGYAVRGDFDPVVTLRLGSALPLWRGARQGPQVEAARAEAAMAREELRRSAAEARTQAAHYVAEWERRDAQVRLLRDAVLPQSRATLEAARSGYETGGVDFSTLIEDFEMWLAAGQDLAEREAARYAAGPELQLLLPPPAPEIGEVSR